MTSPVAYANIVIFYAIQCFVTAHALIRGGSPERAAGGILFIAAVASTAAQVIVGMDFNRLAWTLLSIDVVLSIVVLAIASLADRFWPIWLASLQVIAVANHGVRAYDAAVLSYVYWLIAGKIAYPMLAILFVGTRRHRQRLAAGQQEFGWTFQRGRS